MKNSIILMAIGLLAWCGAAGQELSISTNVLDYADMGTLNVEASYGLSQHWSVNAGAKYNPFEFGSGEYPRIDKQRALYAGVRYWPWHIYSGWWVSGDLRYQEFRTGGPASATATEGDRYGSAMKGGYSYMLGPHFNLDLGLGVWGGYEVYSVYDCPTCGRHVADGARYFVRASDIILSLSYIF